MVHVRQGTGSALFVPSGWHHTVTNLEGTEFGPRRDVCPFAPVPLTSFPSDQR